MMLVTCYFRNSINKYNENRPLVFNNNARRCFLALGSDDKTILGPREEKLDHPNVRDVKNHFGVIKFLLH